MIITWVSLIFIMQWYVKCIGIFTNSSLPFSVTNSVVSNVVGGSTEPPPVTQSLSLITTEAAPCLAVIKDVLLIQLPLSLWAKHSCLSIWTIRIGQISKEDSEHST